VIRFLKEEWLSLAIVLALALGMQAIEYYGWLAGPEGKLMDRLLSAESGMAAESPILLVEIDDEAYSKCFQETSPMNPQAVAGLVAGAMSMAAGEYVSVHSQADTEQADLALERAELKADDKGEHKELMAIYVGRGLDPPLAKKVADQLMAHDALGAHARDELGISETLRARPIQAAMASAGSFAVGSALPLLVSAITPTAGLIPLVSGTSLVFLALLGGVAARAGGAGVTVGAIRVTFWGALAMALTAGVGALFGTIS